MTNVLILYKYKILLLKFSELTSCLLKVLKDTEAFEYASKSR